MDPELLYTKEYCIGPSAPSPGETGTYNMLTLFVQAEAASGRSTKGYVLSGGLNCEREPFGC